MLIPDDINEKVINDFHGEEKEIVNLIFQRILQFDTNYCQVMRSILFLSNGNFKKLIRHYLDYQIDPRELIGEAELRAGNCGHWFMIPFDEIPNFSGKLPPTSLPEYDNNIPF